MNTLNLSAPWARSQRHTTAGLNSAAMAALLAMVLLATLLRGGNRHVAMLMLEWLALAALLAMAWRLLMGGLGIVILRREAGEPRGSTLASAWAWGLLLTAPIWLAGWTVLPVWLGWEQPALAVPDATWSTALVGLPLLACMAAGRWGADAQVSMLAKAWLGVAVLQAVWGLLQVAGLDSLRFGAASGEPAVGSFASKNTYSNLLVMALPLAVWRLNEVRARGRLHHAERASWRIWGWVLALLLMLSVILLGTSRTGIATGVLVLLLALPLLLAQRAGRRSNSLPLRRLWLLAGVAALLGLALLAAGWEWAARFEAGRLLADDAARALMRQTTWHAALAHWPWGSGLGSYASVYPAWHPAQFSRTMIDLAHNDYLQLFMELGLAAIPLAATVLWLLGLRMRQGFVAPVGASKDQHVIIGLQRAAGLSLLAIGLHAWVDYPFHIPANAMMACFLLGVFLRPHEKHHVDA